MISLIRTAFGFWLIETGLRILPDKGLSKFVELLRGLRNR